MRANSPYVPEPMVSERAKEWRRVVKDILSGTLRRESGATIKDEEYVAESQKFIPQPGDSKETVANKLAALRQAGRSIAEGTGRPIATYNYFSEQPPAGSGAAPNVVARPTPMQNGSGVLNTPAGSVKIERIKIGRAHV